MSEETPHPRPFLKWAGGKSQLLSQMEPFFPRSYKRYIEPFLGGGAVFFHLSPTRAILGDSNPDLINVYKTIRDSPENLMTALEVHAKQRLSSKYYYAVRSVDPERLTAVERAARTIFLNKTCFNGLYRVNSTGGFNVPWGGYKNPSLYDRGNIQAASALLKGKDILLADFARTCGKARRGDFVYIDPPYHPLKESSGFTSYTKEMFGEEDQRKLSNVYRILHSKGCLLMLSNSPTPFVRSLYQEFRIETLRAKRAINSKGSGRGPVDELLVLNYN